MTSIFEGQLPKTRPFPIKRRVIWVPGIYIPLWLFNIQPTPPKVHMALLRETNDLISPYIIRPAVISGAGGHVRGDKLTFFINQPASVRIFHESSI